MEENKKGELINQGIAKVLNSDTADIAISLYELLPYRMAGPYGVRFLHAVFKTRYLSCSTMPYALLKYLLNLNLRNTSFLLIAKP